MSAKVCAECGREGSREFTVDVDAGALDVFVCTNRLACMTRQRDEARRQLRAGGKRRLPRRKAFRETTEVAEAVGRLIRAVGRRVADEDLDAIAALLELDDALASAWADAIGQPGAAGLRRNYADRLIGEKIVDPRTGKGITRQAVEQRWPRNRTQEPQA